MDFRFKGSRGRGFGVLRLRAVVLLTILTLYPLTIKPAFAQEPFYKGKTIKIVVGLSAGGGYDRAARLLSRYMGKYIPGNPELIVQNMFGAGSVIATNYVSGVAKPDGLTLLMPHNNVYLSQLAQDQEVKFDLRKFSWIGALEKDDMMIFIRTDAPYKSVADVIKAKEAPKCGTTGVGASDYVMSRLLELTVGAKINNVLGYPGSSEIALAVERGEVQCQGLTISTFFSREPFLTWVTNNFVRALAQSGLKREKRLSATPTIFEIMDEYKTPQSIRRVAQAMLLGGEWARPMLAPPGTPDDRVKLLRDAYEKATADAELVGEAKKLRMEVTLSKGEQLQQMANEVMEQPGEVVEQIKKLFVQ